MLVGLDERDDEVVPDQTRVPRCRRSGEFLRRRSRKRLRRWSRQRLVGERDRRGTELPFVPEADEQKVKGLIGIFSCMLADAPFTTNRHGSS